MSLELIKELRARTGAGMADCKKALGESGNDLDKAVDWLRAKGIANAAKKAGRIAAEGTVGSYIHGEGRIGVLVEINCETDFASRNEHFQALVKDVAMHVAAFSPRYLDRSEVPAADAEAERAVQVQRVMEEGKPQAVAERIVEGRMGKWFEEVCLLDQAWFKDDKQKVSDVVTAAVALIGENIRIRRFARFELGEGIEKKTSDFAAEVAAQIGG
jgi:elongation factor Ts